MATYPRYVKVTSDSLAYRKAKDCGACAIDPESHGWCRHEHAQDLLEHDGEQISVDRSIGGLMRHLWSHDVRTFSSCQGGFAKAHGLVTNRWRGLVRETWVTKSAGPINTGFVMYRAGDAGRLLEALSGWDQRTWFHYPAGPGWACVRWNPVAGLRV